MRIAVIDSGINWNHPKIYNQIKVIESVGIFKDANGKITQSDCINDDIGHGTGVTWLINTYVPSAEFVIIKLFGKDQSPDEDMLLYALKYLYNTTFCDAINISAGVTQCTIVNELNEICDALRRRGSVIVAAFDNDGSFSFPAALESVIGVDISLSCFTPGEYQYVENSPINIRGFGYSQLLPASGNTSVEQSGASFVAPIITGILCRENVLGSQAQIDDFLKKGAKKHYRGHNYCLQPKLHIKKAIICPLTKETKALINYASMLPFQITQICDTKYSGNVGKRASELGYTSDIMPSYLREQTVCSIQNLDWESDADTLIIGHLNMLGKAMKKADIKDQLLRKCAQYHKQVYMYDLEGCSNDVIEIMKNLGISVRVPRITSEDICTYTFGKLYEIATPVLGVWGTSPKQGKFTLQLRLRQALTTAGYKVASLGTEPEAELFGFEGTYPIGYHSTVTLSDGQSVSYVNFLMHQIELLRPDIIIAGSQSQTIPTGNGSLGYFPIAQHDFLLGVYADGYILCVNITDDIDYIKRTIAYLTSVTDAKVIAIVIYPLIYNNSNGYLTTVLEVADCDRLLERATFIETEVGINSYSMNDATLMQKLQKDIEVFFSEGDNSE